MKESKDPGRIQIHSSEGQVILIQDSNHFATDTPNYQAEYFRYEPLPFLNVVPTCSGSSLLQM